MMLGRDHDVVFQRVEDEIVAVHLRTNEIYSFNRTAARFWELLEEERNRSEVETELASEFVVDIERVRTELDRILPRLVEKELVSVDGD